MLSAAAINEIPALLTRASTRPKRSTTSVARATTSPSSDTSVLDDHAVAPRRPTSAAVAPVPATSTRARS